MDGFVDYSTFVFIQRHNGHWVVSLGKDALNVPARALEIVLHLRLYCVCFLLSYSKLRSHLLQEALSDLFLFSNLSPSGPLTDSDGGCPGMPFSSPL